MILPLKRISTGSLITASGAFTWALLTFTYHGWRENWLPAVPMLATYAVLVASWFVLPIGGLLGTYLPRIIQHCSMRAAFVRGSILGICSGTVTAALLSILDEWPTLSGEATIINHEAWQRAFWKQFVFNATTMSLLCAVWVGAWAWFLKRKARQSLTESSKTEPL